MYNTKKQKVKNILGALLMLIGTVGLVLVATTLLSWVLTQNTVWFVYNTDDSYSQIFDNRGFKTALLGVISFFIGLTGKEISD